MNKIIQILKNDVVLSVALLLGLLGITLTRPTLLEVVYFIDFRVLAILLSLMLVMEGFKSTGVFETIANFLLSKCKSQRAIELILIGLCFVSSMLITNDVALITFVPFAIMSLTISKKTNRIVPVVVLQTIAANLGSMFTPLGNPQNLYLYNLMNTDLLSFLKLMFPYTLLALILLVVRREMLNKDINIKVVKLYEDETKEKKNYTSVNITYLILFVVCLLCVLKALDYQCMLIIVLFFIYFVDKTLIKRADYNLLLTFIGFFLFTGSITKIESISNLLSTIVSGREFLFGVMLSQGISNVPAAMLLSNFAANLKHLTIGVNIGGLGTLIASMASLISYKQIVKNVPTVKGKYFKMFTIENIIFLIMEVILFVVIG